MAALALILTACSSDDNDLNIAPQPRQAGGITITAQLAPKTSTTATRAVADNGDNQITVTWAVNEHIAILYTKDATQYAADATVTAVDGTTGAATITFTVESGTADDTPCALVYPYDAAKDDHSGVKDAATLLAAQDGTLNANLDVRVGAGTIQTSTPGLTVTTQPAAQYAIFKFTTKTSNGSATIDVTSLTVTTGGQDYVITPTSATSALYAALPAVSGEAVTFTATGSDSKTYTASKASVTFAAGKYYQSNIKLTEAPAVTLVTAITLNKTATTITKVNGTATETLSVTAVTPDEATDKTYTWSSDATGVATVDADGKVTAVAAGTAHIRATANDGSGVYGECTVTVSDLSAYYSKMVECGCDDLEDKCANPDNPLSTFTGQVLSAAQAIALAQAKAADTGSNCAVFYDSGDFAQIKFAKNDGTTGSKIFYRSASESGLSGYKGYYVSK